MLAYQLQMQYRSHFNCTRWQQECDKLIVWGAISYNWIHFFYTSINNIIFWYGGLCPIYPGINLKQLPCGSCRIWTDPHLQKPSSEIIRTISRAGCLGLYPRATKFRGCKTFPPCSIDNLIWGPISCCLHLTPTLQGIKIASYRSATTLYNI